MNSTTTATTSTSTGISEFMLGQAAALVRRLFGAASMQHSAQQRQPRIRAWWSDL